MLNISSQQWITGVIHCLLQVNRLEGKRGGMEQASRGTQSPVDESFTRGGSRGSAEWGKSSQNQSQVA